MKAILTAEEAIQIHHAISLLELNNNVSADNEICHHSVHAVSVKQVAVLREILGGESMAKK